ncbi:MAG: HAD hydrolase-like protein [Solobacterium sp.]|nr:HAD hydrolase-like protein [Solobacterium sp.]
MGKQKIKVSKAMKQRQKEVGTPAIIFNFDGTVMDTAPAVIASYRHVFAKYGKASEFTPERQQMVIGKSVPEMMKEFFPDLKVDETAGEFRSYQHYHLRDLIQPMPGVLDLFKWLKKHDYKIAIVSSRSRESVVAALEHEEMTPYVDVIIGRYITGKAEGEKDSLRKACELMKKKCCIYIGDMPEDIIRGHMVGAFTIAYVSSRRLLYDIIDAGPDFVTADYKQVRKLLEGEPYWLAYDLLPETTEETEKTEEKEETKA